LSYHGNPGAWRTEVLSRTTSTPSAVEATGSHVAWIGQEEFAGTTEHRGGKHQITIKVLGWVLTVLIVIIALPVIFFLAHFLFGPGPDFASRGNHMTRYGLSGLCT
jgi:hypothetical protein